MAILADSNIRKNEYEKMERHHSLKEQLEQLWKVKSEVVPVVIKALGAVTPKQEEWLQQILVNTSEVSVYKSAAI